MTTTGTRTFDCPWCGAISPVPASHLGEHFACPECKKGTKLTEKNTANRAVSATPPDAPHMSGERTFDCPWCGAIASVPSSYLGEGFACPECERSTKLTATNTRRAAVTAPPPDAPHPGVSSGAGPKILAAAVVAAVGVGAWWFLAGPGAKKPDSNTSVAKDVGTIDKAPGVNPSTRSSPSGPAASSGTPLAMTPDVPPGPAPVGPSAPVDADRAEAARLAATQLAVQIELAEQWLASQTKALADWSDAHPGALDARDVAAALGEVVAEVDRALADKALIPDPATATPEQVRAAAAAVRAFIEASPARQKATLAVVEAMRSDHGGREVAGITDWHEVHVAGEGFRRGAAGLRASLEVLASTVPADLVKAVADAAAARDALKAPLK